MSCCLCFYYISIRGKSPRSRSHSCSQRRYLLAGNSTLTSCKYNDAPYLPHNMSAWYPLLTPIFSPLLKDNGSYAPGNSPRGDPKYQYLPCRPPWHWSGAGPMSQGEREICSQVRNQTPGVGWPRPYRVTEVALPGLEQRLPPLHYGIKGNVPSNRPLGEITPSMGH